MQLCLVTSTSRDEASPAGGGGWAGAREAYTAVSHSCSSSVVRSTEVMLTSFSWLSFSHAVRFARTGGSCGRPVCHSVSEVCSRSVTGAVDTRRLAHRCALRRARESRQSPRQLRRRPWLSLRAGAFVPILWPICFCTSILGV